MEVLCNIFSLSLFYAVMNYVTQGGGVSVQLPLMLLEIKVGETSVERCSLLGGSEEESVCSPLARQGAEVQTNS